VPIIVLGFALLAPIVLSAQAQEVQASVDWETALLTVEVERPIPDTGPNLPAAVSATRTAIERDAPAIVVEELRLLTYDSLRTVNELLEENPSLIVPLTRAASLARTTDARATVDLRHVVVSFTLDLNAAVVPVLIRHDEPVPLAGRLGWQPTTEYSGVVIYAAGDLPLHGTDGSSHVQPALLPGIYRLNEAGDGVEPMMEAGYVDPEALAKWGPVFYSDDVVGAELTRRIGPRPLRIVARAVFGRYPTDVVIGFDDALQILANENNRSLIAEGRVAIILDSDSM